MAIAEKGLMVLDCKARGKSGHAAREEGINAIELAIRDIEWFVKFRFPERSGLLGDVKMTVTMIRSGIQHNVIPDECDFVVDVRSTDLYSNDRILETVRKNISSSVTARSTRLQPSSISDQHMLLRAARSMGVELFGSATLSDQALMPFPTVKIGPGESKRSHTADEYITIDEIRQGISIYFNLLNSILSNLLK
jgi:acetylornithine deacetylase